ncbi:MAG TPA: aldo/keto reductase [Pseudonocardiaceae bacterium]|jgi:aryl-alcohol dehydrogenase-like predicted oxidoreductase
MSVPKIAAVALGAGGPRVGVQGLGCMGFDGTEPTVALDAALAAGVTLFDTADVYGCGASERFLAPFLRAHRDEIMIGTKFGRVRGGPVRNDRDYLRRAVDGSLRRLGVDVIDVYYLHRRDPEMPLADSVGAMAELVTEGKVRHLGLCEVSGEELRVAQAVHPIAAVQSEWSIFARDVETSLVPVAGELGVAVVPYSPLGRGFLTGAFTDAATDLSADDYRRHHPRLTGDNARANADLLVPLRTIADGAGATAAQIALAWVQQRATVHGLCAVVPIPGTRRPSRIIENAGATRITLSEPELALLEPIADRVAGERFNGATHRPPVRR